MTSSSRNKKQTFTFPSTTSVGDVDGAGESNGWFKSSFTVPVSVSPEFLAKTRTKL